MIDTTTRRLLRMALPLGAALPLIAAPLLSACKRDTKSEPTQETRNEVAQQGEPGAAQADPPSAAGAPEPQGTTPPPSTPPTGAPPPQAGAANPAQPQGQPPPGPAPSDEELDKFAEALVEVRSVGNSYSDKISAAESAEEAQALQQKAMEEMKTKLADVGMEVKEYERLASQVKARPELQAKVEAKVEELN